MLKCGRCGKSISGKYVTALGQSWHSRCFRCAGCDKPFGDRSFLVKDHAPYHERCYHQRFTQPCEICGAPLVGRYLTDIHGHAFCARHQKECMSCEACQRLISDGLTGGGVRYDDGLVICNRCSPVAVTRQADAERVFAGVRKEFEASGFSFSGNTTPLRLVDRNELKRHQSKRRDKRTVLGMARKQTLTRQKRGRKGTGEVVRREFLEIIIQAGLPRELFETVAVHELCHAWLFFAGAYDLPIKVEEGLCTLCEDLWITHHPTPDNRARQKALRENKDPVYGDGYRHAFRVYQARGRANLFKYVLRHGRFPRLGLFS